MTTGTRRGVATPRARALLEREKELTRLSDELARERQALPWVPVEKEYDFDTEDGRKTLAELFDGRSQLIVYHFMFGPDWEEGCPSCSSLGDHIDLPRVHLEHHDVTWVAVSRAPLEKLLAYRERMGWTFPWVSSLGQRLQLRLQGLLDRGAAAAGVQLPRGAGGAAGRPRGELPGASMFALRDGVVYHTYSAYARGLDATWGMFQWLDRAPLGRNEADGYWLRRHDQYETDGRRDLRARRRRPGRGAPAVRPGERRGALAAARAWVARGPLAERADRPQLLLHDRHLLRDRLLGGAVGEEQREQVLACLPLGTTRLKAPVGGTWGAGCRPCRARGDAQVDEELVVDQPVAVLGADARGEVRRPPRQGVGVAHEVEDLCRARLDRNRAGFGHCSYACVDDIHMHTICQRVSSRGMREDLGALFARITRRLIEPSGRCWTPTACRCGATSPCNRLASRRPRPSWRSRPRSGTTRPG